MTLAIGASKTAFPDYQQQSQPQLQPQQAAPQVGPLGLGPGGPGAYLQQAPPYEQHRHHALHHSHHTPPPSSPSSTITTAAAAGNCCCPTSSSSSSSPSSGSSAASSRRGSRSSGDELGGGGDGSVAWYCCCCCASPRAGRKRRSMLASVGVCVLVLVYTLLGAFAFMALEGSGFSSKHPGPPDPVTRASAPAHDELRTKTVEKLWSITEDLNILYKDNWTRLAAQEVLRFQDMLVQNIKSGVAVNGGVAGGAVVAADAKDGKQVAKAATVTTAASTYQPGHRWTFPSSFLYSLTLITTIGYGSVSPRTTWGRLVSISYAIIGIPLMLLYLSTTGESLARTLRQAYSRMCYRRGACPEKMRQLKQAGKASKQSKAKSAKGKAAKGAKAKAGKQAAAVISSGKAPAATSSMKAHQAHQASHLGLALGATDELTLKADRAMVVVDCGAGDGVGLSGGSGPTLADTPPPPPPPLASVRVPVVLCLLVLLLYVAGGAFLFHYLEGWTLVEGSYFCFTTLGTIGFGDLIPGRSAASLRRGLRGEVLSVLAASAYILLGMALVAMTFALVQDEFVSLMRRLGRQCSSSRNVQPARPKARPSCSDSESNTEPQGASLGAESLPMAPMAVVSAS